MTTYVRPLMRDLTYAEYEAKFGAPIDFGKISETEMRTQLSTTYYVKNGKAGSSVQFKGARPNLRFGRTSPIVHRKTPGPYEGKRGVTVWGLWMRLTDPSEVANAKIWNEVLRTKIPPALQGPDGGPPGHYKDIFSVNEDGSVNMSAQWETSDLERRASPTEVLAQGPHGTCLKSLVTEYDLARTDDGTPILDARGRGRHVSKEAMKEDVRECTRGKITVNIAPWHDVEKGCGWSAYAYEVGIKSAPPPEAAALVDDDPEVIAAAAVRAATAKVVSTEDSTTATAKSTVDSTTAATNAVSTKNSTTAGHNHGTAAPDEGQATDITHRDSTTAWDEDVDVTSGSGAGGAPQIPVDGNAGEDSDAGLAYTQAPAQSVTKRAFTSDGELEFGTGGSPPTKVARKTTGKTTVKKVTA